MAGLRNQKAKNRAEAQSEHEKDGDTVLFIRRHQIILAQRARCSFGINPFTLCTDGRNWRLIQKLRIFSPTVRVILHVNRLVHRRSGPVSLFVGVDGGAALHGGADIV